MSVPYLAFSDARVVGDPRFKVSDNGTAVIQLRLVAADRRRTEDGKWENGDEFWVTATAFKGLAEHIRDSIRDGDLVTGQGRLITQSWEDASGAQRSAAKLILTSLGPSLLLRRRRHESEVRAEALGQAPAPAPPGETWP